MKKKIKNPNSLSGKYSSYANSLVNGKVADYHMVCENEIAEMLKDDYTPREIAEELGLIIADVYRTIRRIRLKKSG